MAVTFDDFQRLTWRQQGLIVVAVAGGLLALFWYQFLTPIATEIEGKQSQLNQLRQEVAVALERRERLAAIRAESEQLQRRLDALRTILPLERETDMILRQVQQAATDSSLRIMRVAPRAVVNHDVYSEWPIDMQVQATYHNMGMFLDRIRQLPRIVNISALQLNTTGDGVSTSVSATYTATTFVYREEAALPAN